MPREFRSFVPRATGLREKITWIVTTAYQTPHKGLSKSPRLKRDWFHIGGMMNSWV